MLVQHTSHRERGQIYLPGMNWSLFLAVATLVLAFCSSTNLAAAYNIAVTGTMIITTLLVYVVAHRLWGWGPLRGGLILGAFLAVNLAFFSANLIKFADGSWFPLAFAAVVFLFMTTRKRGRDLLKERRDRDALPLAAFVEGLGQSDTPLIPGTTVYLTPHPDQVPHSLLHSLKHFKSLHGRVVILNVAFTDQPFVPTSGRVQVEHLGGRFHRDRVRFGFMDKPDLSKTLYTCAGKGMPCDPEDTTFILVRKTLIAKKRSDMAFWRGHLFIAMARNAGGPARYFSLTPTRVVELGAQVVL